MDANFLNAKFNSDDDDEDYVPDADLDDSISHLFHINILEKKKNKNNGGKSDQSDEDEDLNGIAGLKAMKRKKEIDDLWALMQEDDDLYSKKKALKTTEN